MMATTNGYHPKKDAQNGFATLGDKVAALTTKLSSQLQAINHPQPSFAADGPSGYPADAEVQSTRLQLLEVVSDLQCLATGAEDYFFLYGGLFINHDGTVLDILNQFDFWAKVPLNGSASYAELANGTDLPEAIVRRVLNYAFTMKIFAPVENGEKISHTAYSAHMARTRLAKSWVGHALEEAGPASSAAGEALKRFNIGKEEPSEDLHETAFSLVWPKLKDGRLADFWSVGEDDPKDAWRAKRFSEAMEASVASAVVAADDVADKFDWESLGEASVIDVGGADGSLATVLARKYPQLRFTVQDLARNQKEFESHDGERSDLAGRVRFEAQDFFQPQSSKADAFLLKHVLHNWPDKYGIQILQNLVKALNPGGHILICDAVVPSPQEAQSLPLNVRKAIAGADMQMMVMLNAAERTRDGWEKLAAKADPRLKLVSLHSVPGAIFAD